MFPHSISNRSKLFVDIWLQRIGEKAGVFFSLAPPESSGIRGGEFRNSLFLGVVNGDNDNIALSFFT